MRRDILVILMGTDHDASLTGFVSWNRIAEQLRAAGEFRDNEELVKLIVDRDGIQYTVGSKRDRGAT